jgi:hypothetical protein
VYQRDLGSTGFASRVLASVRAQAALVVRGGFDDQLHAISRATDAGITYLDTALGSGLACRKRTSVVRSASSAPGDVPSGSAPGSTR